MTPSRAPKRAILATTLASLLVAGAVPASAVNIPEGGAVTPDSLFLFHLRVVEGCDGLPVNELEVTIPQGVVNPTPEAVPGWDTHIEVLDAEAGEVTQAESEGPDGEQLEQTVIRWDGGSLDDGLLLDFGIRARFPDEQDAVLEFPVVKRCGAVEQAFAPTVRLTTRYGQGEIAALAESVDQLRSEIDVLRADVDEIQGQIGEVNVTGLRNRVEVLEETVVELDERVSVVEEAGDDASATDG